MYCESHGALSQHKQLLDYIWRKISVPVGHSLVSVSSYPCIKIMPGWRLTMLRRKRSCLGNLLQLIHMTVVEFNKFYGVDWNHHRMLLKCQGSNGLMHESVHVQNPKKITREVGILLSVHIYDLTMIGKARCATTCDSYQHVTSIVVVWMGQCDVGRLHWGEYRYWLQRWSGNEEAGK